MKIACAEVGGAARVALVDGDELRLLAADTDVFELLADPARADPSGETVPLEGARLLAPVPARVALRDYLTFEQHVTAMMRINDPAGAPHPQWYEAPTYYFSNPASVYGPHDDIPIPPGCEVLDYELELAAVVGRDARDVSPAQAREHIAGYTIWNDWSARDLQFEEMQVGLGPAKGKDSANTLGPWIVTADELEPYRRDGRITLRMDVYVNGERMGGDSSGSMAWPFEDMLAYAARGTVVRAGDVLGSGTCGGGCLAELWSNAGKREPRPLAPGDVVRMEIERIGAIENRVVPGAEPVPVPKARRRT